MSKVIQTRPDAKFGSFFARYFFERIGTKAVLKAPSANNRRNILGKEKAIKNASAVGPEPKKFAINTSLQKTQYSTA